MTLVKSILVTLLGLSLLGCGTAPTVSATGKVEPTSTTTQTRQSLNKEKQADAIIKKVVDAINKKDAAAIAPYLIRKDQGVDLAKAAIQDYNTYFKGEKVTRFERVGAAPNRPDTFLYKISNKNGLNKEIFVSFQQQEPQVYDEFLNYSYSSKGLLENFVTSIQRKDATKLARVLSPDDIDYSVTNAKKVISNYEQKFDTNTIKYRLEGLEDKTGSFIYTLYGSKGGKPVQHKVTVIHGDGLVGLKDALIPATTASY